MKNLRSQQKIYATAGRTGRDKYDLCLIVNISIVLFSQVRLPYNCEHISWLHCTHRCVHAQVLRFKQIVILVASIPPNCS